MSDDEDEKPKRVMKTTEVKINDNLDVIQKRAKDVDAFLAKSNSKDAVLAAIADPPLGTKNEQARDVSARNASNVFFLYLYVGRGLTVWQNS